MLFGLVMTAFLAAAFIIQNSVIMFITPGDEEIIYAIIVLLLFTSSTLADWVMMTSLINSKLM